MLSGDTVGAQHPPGPDAAQAGVVLSKSADSAYPRLAQQARIAGDVDLTVEVKPDGTVESVRVVSGHPMLIEAALGSARRSQYECRGCTAATTSYALTYKFKITPRAPPINCEAQTENATVPEVDLSRHEVTIFGWEMWTCDPTTRITSIRFRSGKCLYLWRCGRHILEAAVD